MVFSTKGWYERLKDKSFWNKITMKDIRKELRRLDVEIRREQEELRKIGRKEDALRAKAKGKNAIEKRGIAKEIKMLRRESRAHEAMLNDTYNQKTTFQQVNLYKTMELKAKKKGLQRTFKKNQERVIDLISDKGVDITDEMGIWHTLAQETDVVFDSILQNDEEEEDIMAELEEDEMDDDLDGLDVARERSRDTDEVVSLRKKLRNRD